MEYLRLNFNLLKRVFSLYNVSASKVNREGNNDKLIATAKGAGRFVLTKMSITMMKI